MIEAIFSIGDNSVYENYPRATDYKIDGEWIGLYDNSNIQVGTINLNNLISRGFIRKCG